MGLSLSAAPSDSAPCQDVCWLSAIQPDHLLVPWTLSHAHWSKSRGSLSSLCWTVLHLVVRLMGRSVIMLYRLI